MGVWVLLVTWCFPNGKGADDFRLALAEGDARYQQLDEAGAYIAYQRAHRMAPRDAAALEKVTRACIELANDLARRRSKEAEKYYSQAVQYAELMKRVFPGREQTFFYLALRTAVFPCSKVAARS